MFWKTQDRAIDKLLGAQRGRQNAPARICREFDPDLANAYIEHSLTATEATRYELHLSECAPCRKDIVALARMAEADTSVPRAEVRSLALAGGTQTGVKRLLGAVSVPQWAMAAAAIIVIAISLPMLISRKDTPPEQESVIANGESAPSSAAPQSAPNPEAPKVVSAASRVQLEQQASGNAESKNEKERDQAAKSEIAKAVVPPAETAPAGVSGGAVAPAPPTEPAQNKPDSASADQAASKTAEQSQPAAPAPAPTTQQSETQLAKINPEDARRLPQKDDSAQVAQLPSARVDGEESRKQEATIRNNDSIAPPPKQSGPNVGTRREMTGGPGSAARFRAGRSEPPRGAPDRKVGGRKFWLRDNVWTDKEYNPNKEMPFVPVIRDSDVYRELLSKHSGMKPFLTNFEENATVIFVYKGTVYKLIPQESSK